MTVTDTTKRFAKGAGWLYLHRWLERLLDFISVVILARILAHEDFGLVAIAASLVVIIEGLSDFDVSKALIRFRDESRSLFDSAWTLSVLRGLVSALLMLSIASFLTDTRIAELLYVLALSPLLTGLSNPRFVVFERNLLYSKFAVLTLVAKIISVLVTLAVALIYQSYWSIVLGMLTMSLSSMILTYVLRPYRPRISFARFRDIFSFSGWMSLTTMITTLSMETDRLIVGRLLGIAEAGLYFMTTRIGVMPTRELISPLRRILYPSFSEIAYDRYRLRRAVCESTNVLGSLSLPAGCGFALIANDFVPLVLGDRWITIVPLLIVLVPFLGMRATLAMTQPCVMALGQSRLLFKVSLVYAMVHLPVFIAGTAAYGLKGAVWGIVLAGMFYSYLNLWLLRQTLEISMLEVFTQLRRPVVATIAMIGAVFLLNAILPIALFSEQGSWLSLLLKIGLGGFVFSAMQYAVWRLQGRPSGIEQRLSQVLSR